MRHGAARQARRQADTRTAAEVLGKDPATLTKDERNIAKMVNFGIIYGISSFGLSENLEIPREEGRAARLVLQVHDELLLEVPDPDRVAARRPRNFPSGTERA